MLHFNVILFASAIFAFCESASILDKVKNKCSLNDDNCVRELYRILLQVISDEGIQDLGVPRLDPYVIKDVGIVAFGMIKFTMKEVEAKGFKSCYSTSFKTDLQNLRTTIDFVCDQFSFDGSYKIESTPTLLALTGGINIHGEGNGGIVIEKVQLSFDFAFEVKKLEDGELHIQLKPDESSHNFEVKEKVTVHADNLLVGSQEISAVAVNIFNENWDSVTKILGKNVVDKAIEVFFQQAQVVLTKIPAKEFFTDDLSSYVKS